MTTAVGSKSWWRAELRRRAVRPGPIRSAAVRRLLRPFLEALDGPVVAYRALVDEVDLDPLLDSMPERFASTRTPEVGDLTVHPFDGPQERHRFGFLQPAVDAPVVPDDELAAVLVPGMAFAPDGARLGRGAGHYDRFLARLDDRVLRIGVLTAASLVLRLPTEPHDRPMTHLVTEAGMIEV